MLDLHTEIKREKPQKPRKVSQSGTRGNVGLGICVVCFIFAICAGFHFPAFVAYFVYGSLGVYAYALLFLGFFAGLSLKFSKSYAVNRGYITCASIMLASVLALIHLLATKNYIAGVTLGDYIAHGFNNITPGGAVFSVLSFVIWNIFGESPIGSGVVLGTTFLISFAFLTTFVVSNHGENKIIKRKPKSNITEVTADPYDRDRVELAKKLDDKYQELLQTQSRKNMNAEKSRLGLDKIAPPTLAPAKYASTVSATALNPSQPNPYIADEINKMSTEAAQKFNAGLMYSAPTHNTYTMPQPEVAQQIPSYQPQYIDQPQTVAPIPASHSAQLFARSDYDYEPEPTPNTPFSAPSQPYVAPQVESMLTEYSLENEKTPMSFTATTRGRVPKQTPVIQGQTSFGNVMEETKKPKVYKPRKYMRPSLDMIKTESTDLSAFHVDAEIKKGMLDAKFTEFNVNARVTGYTVAPAITRFEVSLGLGTRVGEVYKLEKDIQVILGTTEIRIENVEGKNAIGIEVPNKTVGCVSLRDILTSKEWAQNKHPLTIAIGKNVNDEVVIDNIGDMPHLLIAGSTGSGKSVGITTLLTSLVYRADPADVKLLLVDMKRVELAMFREIPHMLIPNSIEEVEHAINALKWMQDEMNRRYKVLQENGLKNLGQYHALPTYQNGTLERMPYIVMIIDEAADLIYSGKRAVEDAVKRLAALGRASGIHLVLATQRPSVDVITSVIKANLRVRIGFKTISQGDSQTIINTVGCEKLVGRGDMLFLNDKGRLQRVQGAFVKDEEARNIMNYIRENNTAEFNNEVEDYILNGPPQTKNNVANGFGDGGIGSRGEDPAFVPILRWLVRPENTKQIASIAGVQRQFSLGFGRAGRIIDQMTQMGYVSEDNGAKGRMVLITREEVENLYGAE